jgi:phenylalanyl-tRNA synthetase beta chain
MQISLKWVNELVNIETVNLNYLIEKLTLGGFEVEDILELQISNQEIITLDISATANRSDSLSIQGISKEIAVLLNKPSKNLKYSINDLKWKQNFDSLAEPIIKDSNSSVFTTVIIENLTNITIPNWLQQKLISSGIPIENNLLDFKNYILLETGYPFEFYDLNKIQLKLNEPKFNLSLAYASKNQEFFASNDIKYRIDDSTLLLKANQLPISIAGIIPHKDFCYSNTTTSLLIEGSIFNATKIRQQSRHLGLRTDRSARYEKSLKNLNLLESLYRLVSLLRISNPKLTCKIHTINKISEPSLKLIKLNYKTINEILGPINSYNKNDFVYVTPKMINNYLTRLNFSYQYDKIKLVWKVQIPYSRSEDITREIDLIEEIGRLHGFNNFLTRLPNLKQFGIEDSSYKTRKKLTTCLLNLGLNELIHYSLVNEQTVINNEITLINPLLTEYSNLRASLLPNLLKTIQENLKQGNLTLEGFEYGHVFSGYIGKSFQEKENIAGIFGGKKIKRQWSENLTSLSWFEGKGKMEHLFNQLNLKIDWKPSLISNPLFHPYCTADLILPNKTTLGVFGQVNPILAKKLNISQELYMFEFDFASIETELNKNKLTNYQEYSLYPKVIKDLSFIINKNISFQEIQETLYLNGSKFLVQISLLDQYKGTSIPDNHISLCLQLIFQSNKSTLQNKELEKIINKLQLLLVNKFNAVIRS